jgi:2',3'-cyclic-nucleotide 2'-phosphodiesterase (5'-nucleotidase family)
MLRKSLSRNAVALLSMLAGCVSAPAARDEPAAIEIVLAATTDVHGRLRGWDYYQSDPSKAVEPRGLARAATIVDSVRAAHPGGVVLVDAGDLLQGNPLAYVAARVSNDTLNPIVGAMNALRYDAAAVGNHEFNYGLPYLERAVRQARFPFLAANAYRADGGRAFPAYTIVERRGVKIGIVGATNPGSMIWDRDNLKDRLVIRDIVPEVKAAVAEARAAGADIVVATVHSGLTGEASYDSAGTGVPSENVSARLAWEVPELAAVVFGHTHREVADTTINGVLLMQPRNWASSVGIAHLALERRGGRWTVASKRGAVVSTAGHEEHPAIVAATEGAHLATISYVTSPIGSTTERWTADSARIADTPIVDLVLEVERAATGADLASTAAFSLDARLGPGPITIADLARLYPYDNTLRAVRISGRQLREYLEYSARYYAGWPGGAEGIVADDVPGYNFDIVAGADYTLDVSRPLGERVVRLEVGGRPVAPTDSFTLALNNYRQTGGGGYAMLQGAPVVDDRQEEIRQLLIDEVRRRGTIRPEDYHRRNWALLPAEARTAALAEMRAGRGDGGRASGTVAASGTRLRIVATNDFHGALESRPDSRGVVRGGAAAVAAEIDSARADCVAPACQLLLLDGGDMWQGTPASNLAFGRPVVLLYEMLGYAASALGNHEFDWGQDTLRARMREAPFAILGANVRHADGRDVEWIPNDTLVSRGSLRIGVIGVATVVTATTTRASNVVGLRFDAPAPIVDSIARTLRARGADAVVVVAHAGAFCGQDGAPAADCGGEIVDLARALTEPIDAIVSGHTHSLVRTVVRGIPIVQAMSSGRAIGVVDVRIGAPHDSAALPDVRQVLPDSVTPVAAVDSLVRASVAAIASRVDARIAEVSSTLARERGSGQYALGNLIADAQRWAAKGDVAVMNNGGIRADLRAGPVTYGDLFEIQPFGNVLYAFDVRGDVLRDWLEGLVRREWPDAHVSGVTIVYDPARPAGARIVSATLGGGRPIVDTATYTLVMNDFMATGGDGMGLAGRAGAPRNLSIVDLDALVDYMRSRPQPVTAPSETRVRAVAPSASGR